MSRRTRFILIAHGLTAAAHAVLALALAAVVTWGWLLAIGVWLLVTLRLHRLAHDVPKPRWVTRLVDEPLFVHWGACFIGTLLLLPGAVALGFGVSLPRVAAAAYLSGLVVSAYAVWIRRRRVRVHRFSVVIPGLPPAFDGFVVAQLSDLHIGSFDRVERGLEWAALASSTEPDVALVTGDLVTAGTAFYRDAAEVVGALRAKQGVWVSMGNHDQWNESELVDALEARGARVLRNEQHVIEREGAALVLAGLGDRYTGRDDLEQTLARRPEGAVTVLLSHYPDFFEAAAERGVELTLSGHTHGGQIGLPGLARRVNIASLTGKHAQGLYRRGSAQLYVNAGLGTTGPPLRLGVAPEIAVITLKTG
ncbi:MAG: metallophosphoesterase [Polyangiaceae bacterium]|nr:metallophosphoesterase [Polyangiaceae bacterium]